nr:hypothetical protein CFP56_10998 [Quercus suber]
MSFYLPTQKSPEPSAIEELLEIGSSFLQDHGRRIRISGTAMVRLRSEARVVRSQGSITASCSIRNRWGSRYCSHGMAGGYIQVRTVNIIPNHNHRFMPACLLLRVRTDVVQQQCSSGGRSISIWTDSTSYTQAPRGRANLPMNGSSGNGRERAYSTKADTDIKNSRISECSMGPPWSTVDVEVVRFKPIVIWTAAHRCARRIINVAASPLALLQLHRVFSCAGTLSHLLLRTSLDCCPPAYLALPVPDRDESIFS